MKDGHGGITLGSNRHSDRVLQTGPAYRTGRFDSQRFLNSSAVTYGLLPVLDEGTDGRGRT